MKRSLHHLALAALVALGVTTSAQALPTLYLSSDGVSWTTVAVDGADINPAAGQVTFLGSFGNFNLNVHTGTTYPAIGTVTNPIMDLSFNATSSAAGTLYIAFSADNFGPTNGSPEASIGATVAPNTNIWYRTYGGNSNTLLDMSSLLTAIAGGPGPFSAAVTGVPINNQGPYSLTQVVQITTTAAGRITTGDALLTVPDSGATLMLLGAGLTGLAVLGRSRKLFA